LGFIALVGAIVTVGLINVYALTAFTQWIAAWDNDKDAIICELYTSGSAAAAMTALTTAVEDCIQAIEWTGLLAGLAGTVAPLMGTIMGEVVTNSFVSPLFRLIAAIGMPASEGACLGCSGLLGGWHFDYGVEAWAFSQSIPGQEYPYAGAWEDNPALPDPADSSVPCLQTTITRSSGSLGVSRWSFPGSGLAVSIAHTGDVLTADTRMTVTGGYADRYVQIWYTDASHDSSSDAYGVGWVTQNAVVSAPNNGKTIDSLRVYWLANNAYTAIQHHQVDKVIWTPA
jgi:hypothetical protein